ncbi:hypothetical protein REPUB_Repub04eG0072400 [Reevesia pubescens]
MAELFSPLDASLILQLPLARRIVHDRLVWQGSCLGQFSVRSAYFMAGHVLNKWSLDAAQRDSKWRLIWMAKVQPKVKVFAWRMLHGILPTYNALQQRSIVNNDDCPVWDLTNNPGNILSLSVLLADLSGFVWAIGLQFSWVILTVLINKVVHDSNCKLPSKLVEDAKRFSGDFMSITLHDFQNNSSHVDVVSGWSPSLPGSFKLNVDAYFHAHTQESGFGMLVRDWQGQVVLSASARFGSLQDPLHAEVAAIL